MREDGKKFDRLLDAEHVEQEARKPGTRVVKTVIWYVMVGVVLAVVIPFLRMMFHGFDVAGALIEIGNTLAYITYPLFAMALIAWPITLVILFVILFIIKDILDGDGIKRD